MKRIRLALLAMVVALVLASCSPAASEGTGPHITVFGPYRGIEAERFAASFSVFEERTGIDVRYTGTASLASELQERLDTENPPDIAIVPQPAVAQALADEGRTAPLSAPTLAAIEANYDTTLAETMVVLQGVIYRTSVKSLVWYPPSAFADRGYSVPSSWASMLDLTRQLEDEGHQPWCFSIEAFDATGWVATDWIEDIVLRTASVETYESWVAGDLSFDSPEIRRAFEILKEIIHVPNRVLGGTSRALSVSWTDAGDPMFEEAPRCFLHRQASFYLSSVPDDIDIADDLFVFVLPLIEGPDESQLPPLVLGADTAVAFNVRPAVDQFMEFLATPESGLAWARSGGYLSPHATFDLDDYGPDLTNNFDRVLGELVIRAETKVLDASDRMPPPIGTGTFWRGMEHFVRTGDIDASIAIIESGREP
jgi:alpha-glucoside transport system substrate-binding protein